MGKAKAKGTRAENGVVSVFRQVFPYCERRALRGKNDAGDLTGVPIVIEVKCSVAYIAEAMREAKQAARKLGQEEYGVVCHARGKAPSEDYFVVPAWFGAQLLRAWDWERGPNA